jgi:hypothetical protein
VYVKGCGILPFDSMFSSDHRPLYVDFDVATLFGHPAVRDYYKSPFCKQFDNHNVEGRVTKNYEIDTGEWNNNDEFNLNKIDHDIKRGMECAVNKFQCSQYRKHLWSEQFKRAAYHIQY